LRLENLLTFVPYNLSTMEYKKKGDLSPYLRRDEHQKKYPPGPAKD
jgi:hypothetical protein